ncbi:MAG: hypothetical protein HRU20_25210 [Pseudomonadales bacterium]|nr:hypothetical protein [Pseudomonadales bacterium]
MKNYLYIVTVIFTLAASMEAHAGNIIIDPKGHDSAQLTLASAAKSDKAKTAVGRSVVRGAVIAGAAMKTGTEHSGAARSAAKVGAVAGVAVASVGRRADKVSTQTAQEDAERACLIGRGYSPLN